MIRNVNNTYENVKVKLDNSEFKECKFINCVMEYSGTGPVSLSGCSFENVNWVFTGPAQNTLQFLHGIYHGMGEGGKKLIEQTFENIKKPSKNA
jgi:hypothetical protein